MDLNLDFSDEQLQRYSRHIILPQLGGIGQAKLLSSKVLIIGAGALGSPTALYLAAAGVGTIGIVDMDTVDLSNLQRQVIHSQDTIGKLKVDSAKERIQKLNSDVKVNTYVTMLTSDNIMDIMKDYDIVIDATDNFPTRYLINDACVLLGKPNIYGSILQFEGQTTVFNPPEGPCYRCLYPEPPPPGLVPSCQEGGILGVVSGVIGTFQALETIKLIIGKGKSLAGRLLLFDALEGEFRRIKVRRDPECPICGEHPTITKLIDYELFCGLK